MEKFLVQCLLLLSVISRTTCFQTEISYKIREYVREHQHSLYARHDPIEEFTLEQPLDHFEPSQKTFKQRYMVNTKYWRKEDGPVFLYIGGEGKLSQADIDYGRINLFQSYIELWYFYKTSA